MALYDVVLGDGTQAARGRLMLGLLGAPVIARYRDSWIEKGDDGPVIAIYTRQGGGNRECYCEDHKLDHATVSPADCYAKCNEMLAAHPLFVSDTDDDFDQTYSTVRFRCPEVAAEVREALEAVATDPVDMSARWQEAIARVQSGTLRPAETALADQLGAFLSDPDAPPVLEI